MINIYIYRTIIISTSSILPSDSIISISFYQFLYKIQQQSIPKSKEIPRSPEVALLVISPTRELALQIHREATKKNPKPLGDFHVILTWVYNVYNMGL